MAAPFAALLSSGLGCLGRWTAVPTRPDHADARKLIWMRTTSDQREIGALRAFLVICRPPGPIARDRPSWAILCASARAHVVTRGRRQAASQPAPA